jgi:hypothetical protein
MICTQVSPSHFICHKIPEYKVIEKFWVIHLPIQKEVVSSRVFESCTQAGDSIVKMGKNPKC